MEPVLSNGTFPLFLICYFSATEILTLAMPDCMAFQLSSLISSVFSYLSDDIATKLPYVHNLLLLVQAFKH